LERHDERVGQPSTVERAVNLSRDCDIVFVSTRVQRIERHVDREDVASRPRLNCLATPNDPPGVIDDRILGEQVNESGRIIPIGCADIACR
jgi:hypothetical protein